MKLFRDLEAGDKIMSRRAITDTVIKHWKFASECSSVGGGMSQHTVLVLKKVSKAAGDSWAIAIVPGKSPEATLKMSGEEFAMNFQGI